jgi:hypothetical protein
MIADAAFALGLPAVENLGQFIVSILAVAGAAFLGGLGVGFLTQLLARSLTAKPLPRSALQLVRLLGALACGILVAMLLFGPGGGGGAGQGLGLGNGLGLGKGSTQPPAESPSEKKGPAPAEKPRKEDKPVPPNGILRIEVRGDEPQPQRRFYRVEKETRLQSLEETADILSQRHKENPDLKKVVIVLYKDSPDRDTAPVRELVRLIEARGLTPEISLDPGRAP